MAVAEPRRPRRAPVDKFEERRGELADAALQTLGELGYARTSLREIAQNSEFSHGVVHYYFRDKVELITYCVRHYKEHASPLRRDRRDSADGRRAARRVRRQAGRDAARRRPDAPALVRPALAGMFEEQLREAVVDIDRSSRR